MTEPSDAAPSEAVAVAVFAPSPAVTVTVEAVGGAAGEKVTEVHLHAGGQGFWVGRMMHRLGVTVTLCAVLGGETGTVLRCLIEGEGLELRGVQSESWNGASVQDRSAGERKVIVETSSAPLRRHDLDALYTATLAAAIDTRTCVLTGTAHEVVPPDTYRRLARDLAHNGVEVVVDLSGASLAGALEGGVGLVKLSHEEVVRDGYASSDDLDHLVDAIGKLQAAGARDVVISRSGEPALACFDGRLLEAEVPELEVVEPRGAGDAMTAALAVARARRYVAEEMLRLAVAAGSLNTARHGLGTGEREDVERLAGDVSVRSLRTAAHPDGVCR
jgi:1-phosphofructokinase